MIENKSTDLKILMILTMLSLMFLYLPILNQYPQSLVPYLLLFVFLPGYALLAALKPDVNRIVSWKRLLISVSLGLIIFMLVYVLWNFTPLPSYIGPLAVLLTPAESYMEPILVYIPLAYIISAFFILDLLLIAWVRRKALPLDHKERYLLCRKCRGFYQLREDESPEDFESCQCGGELEYREETQKAMADMELSAEDSPRPQEKPKGSLYFTDLLVASILGFICLLIILTDQSFFIGLAEVLLILLLPGYALINVLYPKGADAGIVERLVYGAAASISLTALLGLALNFTKWNTLEQLILILSIITLIFLVIAFIRRRNTTPRERYHPDTYSFLKGEVSGKNRGSFTEKMLTVLLILSVLLLAFTTYITANPLEGKPYTNFSVVNATGSPVNSLNLTSGEAVNLTVNLANHENKKTTYHLLVNSGNSTITDQDITLENDEIKEVQVNLTAGDPGNRTLEFKLYKLPDNTNIYQLIKIPLMVTEIITQETTTEEIIEENTTG